MSFKLTAEKSRASIDKTELFDEIYEVFNKFALRYNLEISNDRNFDVMRVLSLFDEKNEREIIRMVEEQIDINKKLDPTRSLPSNAEELLKKDEAYSNKRKAYEETLLSSTVDVELLSKIIVAISKTGVHVATVWDNEPELDKNFNVKKVCYYGIGRCYREFAEEATVDGLKFLETTYYRTEHGDKYFVNEKKYRYPFTIRNHSKCPLPCFFFREGNELPADVIHSVVSAYMLSKYPYPLSVYWPDSIPVQYGIPTPYLTIFPSMQVSYAAPEANEYICKVYKVLLERKQLLENKKIDNYLEYMQNCNGNYRPEDGYILLMLNDIPSGTDSMKLGALLEYGSRYGVECVACINSDNLDRDVNCKREILNSIKKQKNGYEFIGDKKYKLISDDGNNRVLTIVNTVGNDKISKIWNFRQGENDILFNCLPEDEKKDFSEEVEPQNEEPAFFDAFATKNQIIIAQTDENERLLATFLLKSLETKDIITFLFNLNEYLDDYECDFARKIGMWNTHPILYYVSVDRIKWGMESILNLVRDHSDKPIHLIISGGEVFFNIFKEEVEKLEIIDRLKFCATNEQIKMTILCKNVDSVRTFISANFEEVIYKYGESENIITPSGRCHFEVFSDDKIGEKIVALKGY